MATATARTAEQAARAYLAEHRPHIREHVQPISDGWHRATITAPHPGDSDVPISRRASSPTQGGAVELARLELRGFALAYFTDPAAHDPQLRADREQLVYDHGAPRSIRLVQAAAEARHAPRPGEAEVGLTWVAMQDHGPVTIGELAAALIARRETSGQQALA